MPPEIITRTSAAPAEPASNSVAAKAKRERAEFAEIDFMLFLPGRLLDWPSCLPEGHYPQSRASLDAQVISRTRHCERSEAESQ